MEIKKLMKKTWPLWCIIPFSIWIAVATITGPQPIREADVFYPPPETQCQEGWIKYELSTGLLCSKYVLSEDQIAEYEK